MGLLSGRSTTQTFYVLGEVPNNFHETYSKNIEANRFLEIDAYADRDESLGWTMIDDILETNMRWDKILITDYLALTLRIDTIKIPGPILKATLKKAFREYREEHDKEHISKMVKLEIQDRIMKEFRKRVLPTIRTFEMIWNMAEGKVYFSGTSTKVHDQFCELFERTFDLRLAAHSCYTALLYGGFAQDVPEKVLQLEPMDFLQGIRM